MSKFVYSVLSIVPALFLACGDAGDMSADGQDHTEQSNLSGAAGCDPLESVLNTMQCIEDEDARCTDLGYNSRFKKLHNGIDTNVPINRLGFWTGTFWFLDLRLDIDHAVQVGEDLVSLRYVETVTFRDGEEFLQHEHALITVDDNCKMLLWDQYGDNEEQRAVDDKAADMLPWGG